MSTPATTVSESISQKTVPAPDLDRLEADRNRLARDAEARSAALERRRTETGKLEETELQPREAAVARMEAEAAALKPPEATTDKVKWEPRPVVDPQDFQKFSMAMIGMALIGGIVSKGNWLGVSSSLNGAMQGYLDGDKQRAENNFRDYQVRFDEALEHDRQAQKEFEDVLRSKTLSINSMLREISNLAAKYNRQDVRFEAEQRSIDGIWRQVEATDRSIAQLEEYNERTGITLRLGLDRLKTQMGAGALEKLDPYGNWFVQQRLAQGDDKPLRELQSRFGGAVAAGMFNEIGKTFSDQGVDPRTLTEAQMNNVVQTSVQRSVSQRIAGVERLTNSIQEIEKRVSDLTTQVNGKGMTKVNATFNRISKELGDRDLSELQTLLAAMGRQYIEAVTMPGSNAQLHATAQQWADGQFDPNTNIANIEGTLAAMNYEIGATKKALHGQLEQSRKEVTGQGLTLPAPTPPTVAPPVEGAVRVP